MKKKISTNTIEFSTIGAWTPNNSNYYVFMFDLIQVKRCKVNKREPNSDTSHPSACWTWLCFIRHSDLFWTIQKLIHHVIFQIANPFLTPFECLLFSVSKILCHSVGEISADEILKTHGTSRPTFNTNCVLSPSALCSTAYEREACVNSEHLVPKQSIFFRRR